MNDAHVHEMQVQMWKANTWGVTGTLVLVPDKLEGENIACQNILLQQIIRLFKFMTC